MSDWDDEDLEQSPYGRTTHVGHRSGAADLAAMRHRQRNIIENHDHLVSNVVFPTPHERAIEQLGLTEAEWQNIVGRVVRAHRRT